MADVMHVVARWDAEAGLWWAVSEDIPGFVTEASTFEELIARSDGVIQELLGENNPAAGDVVIEYQATHFSGIDGSETEPPADMHA